jgi:hypothetical protein
LKSSHISKHVLILENIAMRPPNQINMLSVGIQANIDSRDADHARILVGGEAMSRENIAVA